MNRVEQYRKQRCFRRKVKLAFAVYIIIVTIGICIADYSINNLMNNTNRLKIIDVAKISNEEYGIIFMDKEIYINTQYVKRDLSWVKSSIGRLWR